MMYTIDSIKDNRVVLARDIKSRKGRQIHQRILLEGEQILEWAFEHELDVEYILVSDRAAAGVIEKYLPRTNQIYVVSEGIIKKVTDTNYVIPIVGVAKMPIRKATVISPFVVVLDSIQDFGNTGTIIRTCQAFGIQDIISTTQDFDIYQRKTIEASRGSAFVVRLDRFQNDVESIKYLKKKGYQIVATSPRGQELQSLVKLKPQPVALVVGNESVGISPEFEKQADFLLQIPMYHTIESLNVGVATGISVYEIKLKQVLSMIEEQIKSTLGRELNVAGMLVQQALDVELKKVSELSSRQVIFMMVLKCNQRMRLEEICKQFGVLERESEEFLRPMLASGLIVFDEQYILTDKGEEILAKLWFTVENTEGKILADFADEDAGRLMGSLKQIQEKCVQIMSGN